MFNISSCTSDVTRATHPDSAKGTLPCHASEGRLYLGRHHVELVNLKGVGASSGGIRLCLLHASQLILQSEGGE